MKYTYLLYKTYVFYIDWRLSFIHKLSLLYRTFVPRSNQHYGLQLKKIDGDEKTTKVDSYWGGHTVRSIPFVTAWESKQYFKWLIAYHPLLDEFMDFYKSREGQVILDYGCGPGNDLFRFLVINNAEKVIGMDISERALRCARQRLALHNINPQRIELIRINDSSQRLPIADGTIDHVNCMGVLMHTSSPQVILNEFFRVLKKILLVIMVYNYDSVWLHLYTAYELMILRGKFSNKGINEAFSKNVDGENCPIARCYRPEEFIAMCNLAGLKADFVGGYLSTAELYCYKKFKNKALQDSRLANEHKKFLNNLTEDKRGYPMYNGKYAGVGGVYKLYKG